MPNRRALISGAAASVAAAVLAAPQVRAQAQPRVIVIGGGFAGASCARALKQLDRDLAVTLIEPETAYLACPFRRLRGTGSAGRGRAAAGLRTAVAGDRAGSELL
ncbi:FAD-dependent oxidoreductase [Mesorhizobium sp. M1312]|uniref:FAD-dependent oxidoreductase n=1 Tax=unclassified Mesorhizobium TaxID=325217 RepID=UPI003336498B